MAMLVAGGVSSFVGLARLQRCSDQDREVPGEDERRPGTGSRRNDRERYQDAPHRFEASGGRTGRGGLVPNDSRPDTWQSTARPERSSGLDAGFSGGRASSPRPDVRPPHGQRMTALPDDKAPAGRRGLSRDGLISWRVSARGTVGMQRACSPLDPLRPRGQLPTGSNRTMGVCPPRRWSMAR